MGCTKTHRGLLELFDFISSKSLCQSFKNGLQIWFVLSINIESEQNGKIHRSGKISLKYFSQKPFKFFHTKFYSLGRDTEIIWNHQSTHTQSRKKRKNCHTFMSVLKNKEKPGSRMNDWNSANVPSMLYFIVGNLLLQHYFTSTQSAMTHLFIVEQLLLLFPICPFDAHQIWIDTHSSVCLAMRISFILTITLIETDTPALSLDELL